MVIKKKLNCDMYWNVEEFGKCCVKLKKLGIKDYVVYDFIYIKYLEEISLYIEGK